VSAAKRAAAGPPGMWERLVGQEVAVAALQDALVSGSPGHAWLFVGPEGVGRRPAAMAFAAALNCDRSQTGCGECVSCRKIIRGAHPDVHLIVPEGQQILVDQVRGSANERGVIPEASRSPLEGRTKVFVFEDAAQLNPHAANALLKILEEPPDDVAFLLVTADADALPETVVSRCRRIDFIPLGPQAIRTVLVEHHGLDPQRAEWAARLGGNLARALRLAFDPEAAARRAAHTSLPWTLAGAEPPEAIRAAEEIRREAEVAAHSLEEQHERELAELAEIMGEGRGTAAGRKRVLDRQKREARRAELDAYLFALDDLAAAYRDLLIGSVASSDPALVMDPDSHPSRRPADPSAALRAISSVEHARLAIERNAQPKIAIEALFLELQGFPG
jgi:DNA polymerase III subunit delta'